MDNLVETRLNAIHNAISSNPDYAVANALSDKRYANFQRMLNKHKRKILLDVVDSLTSVYSIIERECYIQGFKDAISVLCAE